MASITEYLERHPQLTDSTEESERPGDGVRISALVLGVSATGVRFMYAGGEYAVDRDDVLEVEEVGDSGTVLLRIRHDARVRSSAVTSARDLVASVPFSLLRGPDRIARSVAPRPREAAWRQATAYVGDYPSLEVYLHPFATLSSCDSTSPGAGFDDTMPDEEHADY